MNTEFSEADGGERSHDSLDLDADPAHTRQSCAEYDDLTVLYMPSIRQSGP